jgi:hypothetical protein
MISSVCRSLFPVSGFLFHSDNLLDMASKHFIIKNLFLQTSKQYIIPTVWNLVGLPYFCQSISFHNCPHRSFLRFIGVSVVDLICMPKVCQNRGIKSMSYDLNELSFFSRRNTNEQKQGFYSWSIKLIE